MSYEEMSAADLARIERLLEQRYRHIAYGRATQRARQQGHLIERRFVAAQRHLVAGAAIDKIKDCARQHALGFCPHRRNIEATPLPAGRPPVHGITTERAILKLQLSSRASPLTANCSGAESYHAAPDGAT